MNRFPATLRLRLPGQALFAWFLALLWALLWTSSGAAAIEAPVPPPISARAWLLMDPASGQTLASHAAEERMEPASLTKLMTAYLVFEALRDRKIALDQAVNVSPRAVKAGGARMFLDPKKPVLIEDLIRGMIVQSGNDATVALAETVAGSEEAFVELMNREAGRMGLKDSHFTNATGLPDSRHYATARDLGLLAATLIRDFPKQYKYYSLKEFRYNNNTQPNRNRLLFLDPAVDGVKTGHTDAAGYCLIASAVRGPRRLLSVLLGAGSDNMRTQESQKLLNYGFRMYDSVRVYAKGAAVSSLKVFKGSERNLEVGVSEDLIVSTPRGSADKLKVELLAKEPLIAPVAAGQAVGSVRIMLDGKPVGEYPVVALGEVRVAGIVGRTIDTIRMWFE